VTAITLTISITGPFSIPTNKCGRGVRPGTHCNVYVVYTPEAVETAYGALAFTFDSQTVSVSLTGNGVSIIPTSFTHVSHNGEGNVNVTLNAEGYVIPDGEQVWLNCIDYEGVKQYRNDGALKSNKATIVFTGPLEDWQCNVRYSGDSEFAGSGYGDFWINLCHDSCECHDTCGGGVTQRWPRDVP
jgi:hypothetical protein